MYASTYVYTAPLPLIRSYAVTQYNSTVYNAVDPHPLVLSNLTMSASARTNCTHYQVQWNYPSDPSSAMEPQLFFGFVNNVNATQTCNSNVSSTVGNGVTYGFTTSLPMTLTPGSDTYVLVQQQVMEQKGSQMSFSNYIMMDTNSYTIDYARSVVTFINAKLYGLITFAEPTTNFQLGSGTVTVNADAAYVGHDISAPWPIYVSAVEAKYKIFRITNYAFNRLYVTVDTDGFDASMIGADLNMMVASDVYTINEGGNTVGGQLANAVTAAANIVTFGFYVRGSPFASQASAMKLYKYDPDVTSTWIDMNAKLNGGVLEASIVPLGGQYVLAVPLISAVTAGINVINNIVNNTYITNNNINNINNNGSTTIDGDTFNNNSSTSSSTLQWYDIASFVLVLLLSILAIGISVYKLTKYVRKRNAASPSLGMFARTSTPHVYSIVQYPFPPNHVEASVNDKFEDIQMTTSPLHVKWNANE